MVLSGQSKVCKHPKAATLYISIPARMAVDSQFDFKAGDKVLLTYLPKGAGSSKVPVLVIHRLRREEE